MRDSGTTGHTVLQIYEILALTCSHVESNQLVSLLRVSRLFFKCTSPLVWKELHSFLPLLSVAQQDGSSYAIESGDTAVDVQNRLSLLRFNVYAPLVKILDFELGDMSGSGRPVWLLFSNLLQCFRPQAPLPNLRRLNLNDSGAELQPPTLDKIMECLGAFLCPSLTGIALPRYHGSHWLEIEDACHFQRAIMAAAPGLEFLQLPLKYSDQPSYDAFTVFSNLVQLRQLRVLNCTGAALNPRALQLIGTLPLLESFRIQTSFSSTHGLFRNGIVFELDGLKLSDNAFPALKHVGLDAVYSSTVLSLWRAGPFVRGLTSIDITFYSDPNLETLRHTIRFICTTSPGIEDLSLGCVITHAPLPNLAMKGVFQRLPLRCVRISFALPFENTQGLLEILPAWTNLQYLEIPMMQVGFNALVTIAKHLPELRLLCVNLEWDDWPENPNLSSITPSSFPLCLRGGFILDTTFEIIEFSREGEVSEFLDVVARNLRSIWPRGVRCEDDDMFAYEGGEYFTEYMDLLQEKINAVDEPMDPKVLTGMDCKSIWRYAQ
ncbi:LRR receptor-like serine/threonine-protein kinase [Ceratobasidium sp. AG-Ba]|nr:LRR receptor-like serine/threonine-protein kinase [Ceratobasidium sp. AG-Ba]